MLHEAQALYGEEVMKSDRAMENEATMIEEMMTGAPKPKPKSAKIVAIGLVLLAVISGCIIVAGVAIQGDIRFATRHEHYAPVIAAIRSHGLKPGEECCYRIDDPADPATLRIVAEPPPRGQGAGTVWARMDRDGQLLVAIETIDRGHMGEFGYFFMDTDTGPKSGEEERSIEGPGREWTLGNYLGDGWWRVSYRLG
jgi:hypothetical protein